MCVCYERKVCVSVCVCAFWGESVWYDGKVRLLTPKQKRMRACKNARPPAGTHASTRVRARGSTHAERPGKTHGRRATHTGTQNCTAKKLPCSFASPCALPFSRVFYQAALKGKVCVLRGTCVF